MIVDVKVPILAESVAEATLITWHKQVGDAVQRGDNLIEIETDKVTLEVTAPESGVIKEIVKLDGAEVKSDEVIARIDTDHAASGVGVRASTASAARPAVAPDAQPSRTEATPKLSPAVRKLLDEHQLDPAAIPTQRADGRITKEDVMNYLSRPQPAPTEARVPERPAAPMPAGARPEQRVPMTRLRRRAAERLLAAQRENAILTTFNEVNMRPVMDLRARYREEFEKAHGVKLGFMSFFTKAAVEALKRFPVVNASVDGTDIVYHGYFDIGIAVGSPRGLVVPILRDADLLSFAEIEKHIRDFGERARDGKLSIEELTGGTFTITNGGIFGSLISTPILNPPQSAILGMHKIQERPVAENGQVVIRPMMYLALSYDHRIIDGREAVQFLVCIKEQIEDPARLLLQV